MKHLLPVCLIAVMSAAVVPCASAQSQELRKGVSVQMATTNNATPMPAADNADAWIIAVTADGSLYFGTKPVTEEELVQDMRVNPRNRAAKLYIKADARAPFASVKAALDAAHSDLFQNVILLTNQAEAATPGTIVLPKGLEILLGTPPSSGAVVVQISTGQTMQVNNQDVPPAALQSTLKNLLQNRSQSVVLVKADDAVPFGQVARVADINASVGAKTVIHTQEP